MSHTKHMQKKGFTLIELLIVIGIIGLLATVAAVSLNSSRAKSRDAKRIADVKAMQSAVEIFFNDNQGYPGGTAIVVGDSTHTALCGKGDGTVGFKVGPCAAAETTYMVGLSPAPLPPTGNAYTYSGLTAAGGACAAGPCASYSLVFTLEGVTGSLNSGAHTANPAGIQ